MINNSIKKYFVFLFILFSGIAVSYSQTRSEWKILDSPVNINLRNMFFLDNLTGWAAGAAGTIIHTKDGGESWVIQNSTVDSWITDIFFIDKNNGRALTFKEVFPFNTVILKTTNGGDDWLAEDFSDLNAFMTAIFFLDSLKGFIGGSYIAVTSDGGNSWFEADIESSLVSAYPIYKFKFYNEQIGYACGGYIDQAGVVWRTTNGGLNWSAEGVSADEVFDIYIADSLNALTLSGDPEGIYPIWEIKTTNAGESWNFIELPYYGLSFAIDFRTSTEGWSASGHKFIKTTDAGESWFEVETPGESIVYTLQFTDLRTGYASGEEGVILKYIPRPSIVDENTIPENFFLYQNYPNPFNPATKLSFLISSSSMVTLKVYNVLGKEIATLINENKHPGFYETDFNAEEYNLASGIYFYKLITEEKTIAKKMVYLR
jgi:photosystem II stability/assembly factor-like uncharacterized protein